MPEPERENVDPKQNTVALEQRKTCGKDQRAVAWQDGVDGKSLFTVGFQGLLELFMFSTGSYALINLQGYVNLISLLRLSM